MSLGIIFPGQGSQEVGMLSALAAENGVLEEYFSRAGEALGLPLWDLVRDGPAKDLNRTAITQPVLLTASVALFQLWRERGGGMPSIVAGHSLGEFSALVCAGVLKFIDAVKLVHIRGTLMQEAVPVGQGGMAAILGLENETVENCCLEASSESRGVVSAANYNSPGQVVIAGDNPSLLLGIDKCQAAGARRTIQLAVSAPFHCALMQPAAEQFRHQLEVTEFRQPTIAVVQNSDARISQGIDELRKKLIDQIAQPVRWTDCVKAMIDFGMRKYVECGPGKVLSGLMRKIDRSVSGGGIDSPQALEKTLEI